MKAASLEASGGVARERYASWWTPIERKNGLQSTLGTAR
jgi:hypothetical protein